MFAYLPRRRARPTPALERQRARSGARPGIPLITIPTARPGRSRPRVPAGRAGRGGRRLGPSDQPVRPAQRAAGQGRDQARARWLRDRRTRCPRSPTPTTRRCARCSATHAPPQLRGDHGLRPALARVRRGRRRAARGDPRARPKATTTFGYGPRFLHSTGQFHKGGPRTGRFLQLLHDGPADVEIPGAPYTFTTLKNAQAIGDCRRCARSGCRPSACACGAMTRAGAARVDREDQGDADAKGDQGGDF